MAETKRKPKAVPKKVIALLERRRRLADKLLSACCDVDKYCASIGIEGYLDDACLGTNIMIYAEPSAAYQCTLECIEETLGIRETTEEPKTVLGAKGYY